MQLTEEQIQQAISGGSMLDRMGLKWVIFQERDVEVGMGGNFEHVGETRCGVDIHLKNETVRVMFASEQDFTKFWSVLSDNRWMDDEHKLLGVSISERLSYFLAGFMAGGLSLFFWVWVLT